MHFSSNFVSTKLKSKLYIQAFKDCELHNRFLNHYCNLFSPDFLGKKWDLKKQYVLTQKCQKHSLQRHGHFVGGFIHDKAINQPPWTIEKRANGSDNGQKMVVVNKSLSKGLVQRSNNLKNSNFYKQIQVNVTNISPFDGNIFDQNCVPKAKQNLVQIFFYFLLNQNKQKIFVVVTKYLIGLILWFSKFCHVKFCLQICNSPVHLDLENDLIQLL